LDEIGATLEFVRGGNGVRKPFEQDIGPRNAAAAAYHVKPLPALGFAGDVIHTTGGIAGLKRYDGWVVAVAPRNAVPGVRSQNLGDDGGGGGRDGLCRLQRQ